MSKINENDYKFHKQLAQNVISDIKKSYDVICKQTIKSYLKITKLMREVSNLEDVEKINSLTAEIDMTKLELVQNLAIVASLKSIIAKNNDRIDYINKMLENIGIYNDRVDKKTFKANQAEINEIKLDGENFKSISFCNDCKLFCKGILLEIKNGSLNFANPYNKELLENNPEEVLKVAFKFYPASISTIEAESLVNIKLKTVLAKQIIYFVVDRIGNFSLEDINKMLGGLLNLSKGVPNSIKEYIFEVENMFNVKIVRFLRKNYSEFSQTIDENLKVNEDSKYL